MKEQFWLTTRNVLNLKKSCKTGFILLEILIFLTDDFNKEKLLPSNEVQVVT